ncbi:hypothetical protein Pmani_025572 [Petrolisthes manimaculis]|uniref:Uncharacterized protein n=1 Tax=Petrolisthes manimaculis TaxID=1843537 RepID=A0AAE1P7V5_9EUCA|nr:hypothetical protein Pmani_025572 [Petrolisthes manimaculis]
MASQTPECAYLHQQHPQENLGCPHLQDNLLHHSNSFISHQENLVNQSSSQPLLQHPQQNLVHQSSHHLSCPQENLVHQSSPHQSASQDNSVHQSSSLLQLQHPQEILVNQCSSQQPHQLLPQENVSYPVPTQPLSGPPCPQDTQPVSQQIVTCPQNVSYNSVPTQPSSHLSLPQDSHPMPQLVTYPQPSQHLPYLQPLQQDSQHIYQQVSSIQEVQPLPHLQPLPQIQQSLPYQPSRPQVQSSLHIQPHPQVRHSVLLQPSIQIQSALLQQPSPKDQQLSVHLQSLPLVQPSVHRQPRPTDLQTSSHLQPHPHTQPTSYQQQQLPQVQHSVHLQPRPPENMSPTQMFQERRGIKRPLPSEQPGPSNHHHLQHDALLAPSKGQKVVAEGGAEEENNEIVFLGINVSCFSDLVQTPLSPAYLTMSPVVSDPQCVHFGMTSGSQSAPTPKTQQPSQSPQNPSPKAAMPAVLDKLCLQAWGLLTGPNGIPKSFEHLPVPIMDSEKNFIMASCRRHTRKGLGTRRTSMMCPHLHHAPLSRLLPPLPHRTPP